MVVKTDGQEQRLPFNIYESLLLTNSSITGNASSSKCRLETPNKSKTVLSLNKTCELIRRGEPDSPHARSAAHITRRNNFRIYEKKTTESNVCVSKSAQRGRERERERGAAHQVSRAIRVERVPPAARCAHKVTLAQLEIGAHDVLHERRALGQRERKAALEEQQIGLRAGAGAAVSGGCARQRLCANSKTQNA